ncbi:glycoside hydrolase family 2 TIM barrel-domain containing protein [Paenibacillus koleovorans]|uniref:glycoside hydrolase family 2 TIM barrel-domain containing protein n=1 Tax=Paenibacillus koleovorans TaxID=121608 RepID=UPI000FD82434|nr:glycoside hydrolase family 2 TIM barrel-domain containing protein [Paenibacillus koleovorans]
MQKQRLIDHWEHYTGSLGGVWEVWRADKLNNHYNVPWHAVKLPHSYNGLDVMDPDSKYYQGPGWYRTRLAIDNPYSEGRTLLLFEGAGQRSRVYVYTQEVGSHLGGYDEFTVDITEAAAEAAGMERYGGVVPVAVMCDNTRELETIPSDASDFNLYGGLYRYVNLVYVPAVSLRHVHVEPVLQPDGKCLVRVRGTLYNPAGKTERLRVEVRIRDACGQVVLERLADAGQPWEGASELARFEIEKPEMWSPDRPYLYRCEVTLSSEAYGKTVESAAFGVRAFEFVRNGPFLLNGERLLLLGTHRHEDHAGVGAAMTEEQIREEMRLIKEMGANFIRLGHYQQSRIVLDCCDELGLLVWEEIPWCRGGLGGEAYRQMCRDMLTAMIEQHYNHPSIILWGLGNENDWECDFDYFDQQDIRAFMKELHELSHALDSNRLTAIRRCEFCKDIIDVYSPSIWAGWYRGIYTDYEASSRQAFENVQSFFHMEWGADNLARRHVERPFTGFEFIPRGEGGTDERDGDYLLTGGEPRVSRDGDWSETYFCDMIDWYLKSQEKMDWLTGAAQWAFKDFATPVRPDSPIPYLNMKGIVERDFTKKEAYYVFQSYWTQEPMLRLYGHTMPVRWGEAGEKKRIKVYSNCEEVELILNGVSLGMKRRDSADFPCAGLRWDTVLAAGENHVRAIGVRNGVTVEDSLTFVYQTEAWGAPAKLRLQAERQADGMVYVEALAVDPAGVPCLDAVHFVRFGISGDGRLVDNLGTVRGSRLIQLACGRAGIVFDPTGALPAAITETGFFSAGGPSSATGGGAAGAAGLVGLAEGAGAAGPVGLAEGAGAAGPVGLAEGAGAAGPVGLAEGAGAAGAVRLAEGAGAAGPVGLAGGAGAAGPVRIAEGAGAAGPVRLVEGAGAAGPVGLAEGAGAAGPVGLAEGAGAAGPVGLADGAGAAGCAGLSEATGTGGRSGAVSVISVKCEGLPTAFLTWGLHKQ